MCRELEMPTPTDPLILLKPDAMKAWARGYDNAWVGPKPATAIPIREPVTISPQRLKEAQQLNSFSDEESGVRKEFTAFVATLPADDKERSRLIKRWLDSRIRDIGLQRNDISKKRDEQVRHHALLNRVVIAWEDLDEWAG